MAQKSDRENGERGLDSLCDQFFILFLFLPFLTSVFCFVCLFFEIEDSQF